MKPLLILLLVLIVGCSTNHNITSPFNQRKYTKGVFSDRLADKPAVVSKPSGNGVLKNIGVQYTKAAINSVTIENNNYEEKKPGIALIIPKLIAGNNTLSEKKQSVYVFLTEALNKPNDDQPAKKESEHILLKIVTVIIFIIMFIDMLLFVSSGFANFFALITGIILIGLAILVHYLSKKAWTHDPYEAVTEKQIDTTNNDATTQKFYQRNGFILKAIGLFFILLGILGIIFFPYATLLGAIGYQLVLIGLLAIFNGAMKRLRQNDDEKKFSLSLFGFSLEIIGSLLFLMVDVFISMSGLSVFWCFVAFDNILYSKNNGYFRVTYLLF